ncbi:hypothetical protein [Sellimonas intestinalis]|uniref:hypothetical protein n=1 Tax=Sellimonas intestinalis TaxID=1653434 RepID=UPI000E402E64|nr:hypothetical protein [Sellimonas intestinalis]RGD36214.1 hypothetical protein DW166_14645 [Sellimonas intestinalis]
MQDSIQSYCMKMLEAASPLRIEEMAQELDVKVEMVRKELASLVSQDLVCKDGDFYYINTRYKMADINKIQKETKELNESYKKELCKLKKRSKNIEIKVNTLYINFITLMSIFVSIFSLIATNASIIFNLTQENTKIVFVGIIVTNLFVVICIVILLIAIKILIINPMQKKE